MSPVPHILYIFHDLFYSQMCSMNHCSHYKIDILRSSTLKYDFQETIWFRESPSLASQFYIPSCITMCVFDCLTAFI